LMALSHSFLAIASVLWVGWVGRRWINPERR
jgi:hypothetical protein